MESYMDAKKYTKKDFDKKKYVEENYEQVAESWRDLQKFLKSFMAFLAVAIVISIYYLVKTQIER